MNLILKSPKGNFLNEKTLNNFSFELEQIIENSRKVFDLLESGIVIYSPDYKIRFFNSYMNELTGLNDDQVIGKSPFEIIESPKCKSIKNQLDDAVKLKEPYSLEYPLEINSSGQKLVVEKITKVISGTKGQIIGILGEVKNITEEKRIEKEFKEKDVLFNESQKKANIGFFKFDLNLGILDDSIYLDEIFGLDSNETKNLELWLELVHPDDKEMMKNYLNNVIKNGQRFDKEYRIIRKNDGEIRWVYGSGRVEIDKENNIISLIGSMQDITEQKMIFDELKSTTDLLLSIANGTIDLIYTKDLKGRYTSVNKAFINFIGLPESEIIGKKTSDIFQIISDNLVLETDDNTIDSEKCLIYEKELKNGDGDVRILSNMKGPTHDSRGKLNGSFGISRDITVQRDNEKKLLMINDQLKEAQKMESIGTLAGGIAHDFNNLLMGIFGNLQLILMDDTINDSDKLYIEKIKKLCERASELIGQIRKLSENSVQEKRIFDIYNVISEVLSFTGKTTNKVIKKEINLQKGIFFINGNESEIHRVLMNLSTNSSLAIEEKGPKKGDFIKISVENCKHCDINSIDIPEGNYIHICFEDSGKGMSEDVREKAFDPFFSTRDNFSQKGQGLGLAVVYNIIKKHKGFINIESKKGKGTTIHIYLPKADLVKKEDKKEALNIIDGNETILIVDDEEMIQNSMKELFESYGYSVILASDGQEGLDTYIKNKESINLVLLDLNMPNLSGNEVLKQLLEINKDIKVIISSGLDLNKSDGILNKVKGYINKPYEISEILTKIRRVLDQKTL